MEMKKTILLLVVLFLMGTAVAKGGKYGQCTTIQEGILTYNEGKYLEGEPLKVGYDIFGYNYQAHMFVGYYANVYLNGDGYPPYEGNDEEYYKRLVDEGYATNISEAEEMMNTLWYWPYRNIWLVMKWNDAWLSNKDCDGDGKLDRHFGYDSYIGSGAWETNHMWGTYEMDGKTCVWDYFVKIVAVPEDAWLGEDGVWYSSDGTEIGPQIWEAFATIQEVYNDPCGGFHGIQYLSPLRAGLGNW